MTNIADLTNRTIFRAFNTCPKADPLDNDHFTTVCTETTTFTRPKSHWVLLVGTVHAVHRDRLAITSIDLTRNSFTILFDYANGGADLNAADFPADTSLALLYAQQRVERAAPSARVVVVKKATHVAHLPLPIERLMALNKVVQAQAVRVDGLYACHTCRKRSAMLLKCTGCGLFRYCGQECQKKMWKNGHKEDCMDLKEVKWLFTLDWETFEAEMAFSA